MVIDGGVHEVVADDGTAARAVLVPVPAASGAAEHPPAATVRDLAELLDVHVHQLARCRPPLSARPGIARQLDAAANPHRRHSEQASSDQVQTTGHYGQTRRPPTCAFRDSSHSTRRSSSCHPATPFLTSVVGTTSKWIKPQSVAAILRLRVEPTWRRPLDRRDLDGVLCWHARPRSTAAGLAATARSYRDGSACAAATAP
jgi:hypothetical protein